MLKKKKFFVHNYDYGEQIIEEYFQENAAWVYCENNHVDDDLRKNGGEKYVSVIDRQPNDFENEETIFCAYCDEKSGKLEIVECGMADWIIDSAIIYHDHRKYSKEKPKFKVQHKYFKDEVIEASSAYDAAEKFCSKHSFVKGWYAYSENIPITVINDLHAIAVYRIKYSDEKTPILYPPFELEYQNYEERKQFPREYWNNWGIPDDKN